MVLNYLSMWKSICVPTYDSVRDPRTSFHADESSQRTNSPLIPELIVINVQFGITWLVFKYHEKKFQMYSFVQNVSQRRTANVRANSNGDEWQSILESGRSLTKRSTISDRQVDMDRRRTKSLSATCWSKIADKRETLTQNLSKMCKIKILDLMCIFFNFSNPHNDVF